MAFLTAFITSQILTTSVLSIVDFGEARVRRASTSRETLIQDLLSGNTQFGKSKGSPYDAKLRPIPSSTNSDGHIDGAVNVKFKIAIDQLIEVNEVKQRIILKTWFIHEWHDSRLKWNPKDYEGIQKVHIDADKLWLPDFMIYNNADGDFAIQDMVRARVDSRDRIGVWDI